MVNLSFSNKRLKIDKANSTMVATVAISSFVIVFSLVACKALLSQRSYQSRVIAAKSDALNQLKSNLDAVGALETQYKAFVETPDNIIGGNSKGNGPRDGDNARIVLDALPSQYDFPGLTSSLEKVLGGNGFSVDSITGTDDEVNQKNATDEKPIEMPVTISVKGNYDQIKKFVSILEYSIRPMKVTNLSFTANEDNIQVSASIVTYYQPAKTFKIDTKEIQ